MKPLFLNPLPSTRSENGTYAHLRVEDDFVEDAVIRAVMLRQNSLGRGRSNSNDLALAADDQDFAGWQAPDLFAEQSLPPRSQLAPSESPSPALHREPEIDVLNVAPVRRNWWWLSGISACFAIGLGVWLMMDPTAAPNQTFQTLLENLDHLPFGLAEAIQETIASQRSGD